MSDDQRQADLSDRGDLPAQVAARERRKLRARREGEESAWFGLGMFGLVGWSVAIPMLLLLALGLWIDAHYPSRFSWTLMLLVAGLMLGCLNAWYWINQERRKIEERQSDDRK